MTYFLFAGFRAKGGASDCQPYTADCDPFPTVADAQARVAAQRWRWAEIAVITESKLTVVTSYDSADGWVTNPDGEPEKAAT